MAKIHHVELIEGATNRAPWGARHRKGVKFPCTNPTQLAYFEGSGRYRVTSREVRKPKVSKPPTSARDTVGTKGRTGPGDAVVITEERLLALAKLPVTVKMSKKRLLSVAHDLGVGGINARKPPTNAQLVKQIVERQAVVLAKLTPADPPE
jgi:hypothetical protein